MKRKLFFIAACIIGISPIIKAQKNDKRNYVSPLDSNLRITKKFDNVNRATWNIGAVAGVDVSSFNGAVYGEISGSFCPKRFIFRGSFAVPITGEIISSSDLYKKSNPYQNITLVGVFNYKDVTENVPHEPTVGIKILGSSSNGTTTTTTYNEFYTDGQTIQKRNSKGLGITFNSISSNLFYDSAKSNPNKTQTVTLENNQNLPNSFLLKYSNTFFGLGWHLSSFESYKYIYEYTYNGEKLGKRVVKQTSFKHTAIEFLLAPGIKHDPTIIYANGNNFLNANIKDVKTRIWGFRLVASTNQLFKGKKMFKTYGKPGFYQNGELGMRPGIFYHKQGQADGAQWIQDILNQPFYMKYGIGITF